MKSESIRTIYNLATLLTAADIDRAQTLLTLALEQLNDEPIEPDNLDALIMAADRLLDDMMQAINDTRAQIIQLSDEMLTGLEQVGKK